MPLYPVICDYCESKDDVMAPASQAGNLKCPRCGCPVEQDYSRKNIGNGNREFHGTTRESLTEWYHSSEVGEVRQGLGKSGECVQPDGTVKFKDRAQQRRYQKDKAAMKRRYAEKREAAA